MEDDEDLEFLRLAALKSLASKKESNHSTTVNKTNVIEVVDSASASIVNTIHHSHPQHPIHHPAINHPQLRHSIVNQPIPHADDMLEEGNIYFEPILTDVNIPYIDRFDMLIQPQKPPHMLMLNSFNPQHHPSVPPIISNNQWLGPTDGYSSQPSVITTIGPAPIVLPAVIPNVQLSPRSAAFVSKNNDILMRRKEGLSPKSPTSPSFRTRSPDSPTYDAKQVSPDFSRWSSPTKRNGSRSPQWRWDRSLSPSPPPAGTAGFHHRKTGGNSRTLSRSPPRRVSPYRSAGTGFTNKLHGRRVSPTGNKNYSTAKNVNNGRNQLHDDRRSPSPLRSNPSGGCSSPYQNSNSYQPNRFNRHRSRSPIRNEKQRSNTRSPLPRKMQRLSRERQQPLRQNAKRRSPVPRGGRDYGRNSGRSNPRNNRYNNSHHGKKTPTSPRRRTRSPLPLKTHLSGETSHKRNDEKDCATATTKSEAQTTTQQDDKDKYISNLKDDNSDVKNVVTTTTPSPKSAIKTEDQLEDELLATTDEEDNDKDDGIDLFASEESESENEGRFKSTSTKSERTKDTCTVSFAKLGTTSEPIKDLNDVGRARTPDYRRDNRGHDRRDRDNRNNYSRDDRFKRNDHRNRSRQTFPSGNNSVNSSWKPKSITTDRSSKSDDKRKEEKSLFKSSFQSVDTEATEKFTKNLSETRSDSKPSDLSTSNSTKTSDVKPKKIQLKRPSNNSDEKTSKSVTIVHSTDSSCIANDASPTDDSLTFSGKKPIHLRLGAMTKTWKTSKKSWRPPEKT